MIKTKFDFSGWATKNDLKCSDGRTIRRDAFKGNDGQKVPLVWQHAHGAPDNILGHAMLENREEGVYAYGLFNDTPNGILAKKMVAAGDITFLSIYANQLVEESKNVMHGVIRELSLVVAGANPGAVIDNLVIAHADGSETDLDGEAIISTGIELSLPEVTPEPEAKPEPKPEPEIIHADAQATAEDNPDETVGDVFDTLTDKQKQVVYAMIAEVVDATATDGGTVSQSDEEGDGKVMKTNVFEKPVNAREEASLTHAQFSEIMEDAKKYGSMKTSFLEHVVTYGIENIDYLFPDAKLIANTPAMLSRRMEWVTAVINGTNHSPFSTIKSMMADITADEARARGYVKGTLKKDEVIKLLMRTTTAKTIYKKQKLDKDDITDITDLDVVAWMKAEMRIMLDEELARAILVSDGRGASDPDKIDEDHIRPIWKDDDMYAHHVRIEADVDTDGKIDAIIRAREIYNGSGTPTFFTASGFVSDMLLLKDSLGRRIYMTRAEVLAVLGVSNIVEVPIMANLTRESDDETPVTLKLLGIVVNLRDYTVGSNKGGEVSTFDDFDIDYNQMKYLIETRVSGALTLPKSALVIEQVVAAG